MRREKSNRIEFNLQAIELRSKAQQYNLLLKRPFIVAIKSICAIQCALLSKYRKEEKKNHKNNPKYFKSLQLYQLDKSTGKTEQKPSINHA